MANRCDGNQCVASFRITIQPTAVDAPTRARPAMPSGTLLVDPNTKVPRAASREPTISRRRAPHESTSTPVGICIST